jgi:DNA-binding NarL/FixJ family response regulator
LLELLAAEQSHHEVLTNILERAADRALATSVGFIMPASVKEGGIANLTKRESDVLELLLQGRMNKEIGRALFISESAVKVHIRNICRKLGVRTRTEAAIRAAELSG